MEKQCRLTGQTFTVSPLEQELYARFDIEPPDLAPLERIRVLASFINGRHFEWRPTGTGSMLYTNHSAKSAFQIVDAAQWQASRGEFLEFYGRDIPSPQEFFNELHALFLDVPRPAIVGECEKSVGTTAVHIGDRLSFVSFAARVHLGTTSAFIHDSRGFSDCFNSSQLKDCLGCIDCRGCVRVAYSERSRNCRESLFLVNCEDCEYCLFCSDLKGKRYYIENEQVTPQEFDRIRAELELEKRQGLEDALAKYYTLRGGQVPRGTNPFSSAISTSLNIWGGNQVTDCVDLVGYTEQIRESVLSVGCGGSAKGLLCSISCWDDVEEIAYSAYCSKSRELLGCFGLENREFCILNKQYTEAEYRELKRDIIQALKRKRSWGRPLPFKFSEFPYNLSLAQDLFPITKVQSALLEVQWDEEAEQFHPQRLLQSEASMARLRDIPLELSESLSQPDAVYLCELTGRPFQYFPGELELLQKLNLAPSPYCFEERYRQMTQRFA